MEFGESFEACARREVLEETGIDLPSPSFKFVTAVNSIMPGKTPGSILHYCVVSQPVLTSHNMGARMGAPRRLAEVYAYAYLKAGCCLHQMI